MSSPLAVPFPPPTFVPGWHDEAAVRKMEYRRFGSRVVSQLTYGASALGGAFGSPGSIAESKEILHTAVKRGINLIDVAPWYGHGAAESVLGEALEGIPREAYYLTTKCVDVLTEGALLPSRRCCRYLPNALEQFDFSYERTLASVRESLARMRVDYIDTVQIHDPEFAPSLDIVVKEALPALLEARRLGLIRAIGITGYPLDMLRELYDKATGAGIPIESCLSYCHYNLHDTTLVDTGLADFFASKGVGLLNGSPLSMSLLTHAGAPAWHPSHADLKAVCVAAAAHCTSAGVNIERLALAFSLESPAIPTTLFSTSKVAKLLLNLEQATGGAPLTAQERSVLGELQRNFFSGPKYASIRSWEGVEPQKVHAKMGRLLLLEWYKSIEAKRAAGTPLSGAVVGEGLVSTSIAVLGNAPPSLPVTPRL